MTTVTPTPMVHQCCGRDVCTGKDCANGGPWEKVPKWRMDAYYYSFEPTGVAAIDKILSAVACAGKSFHHTEHWGEIVDHAREPHASGMSCQDWIQTAANEAAAMLASPTPQEPAVPVPQDDLIDALQLVLCESEAQCGGAEPGCVRCDAVALIRNHFSIAAPLAAMAQGKTNE